MRTLRAAVLCLAAAVVLGAIPARAQSLLHFVGAQPQTCTIAQLAAHTCGARLLNQLVFVSNSDGVEGDNDCGAGTPGTTTILCRYDQLAATWRPVTGSGGGGFSLPAGACVGKANGGKLVQNTSTNIVECVDDIAVAGGTTIIKLRETSAPNRPAMNFTGRAVNTVTDNSGSSQTDIFIPAFIIPVSMGANQFTGTVACSAEPPLVGTMAGCKFYATAFGGQDFSAGGFVEGSGTYNVLAPNTTSDGFRIDAFHFTNACSAAVGKCGPVFRAFQQKVAAVAAIYNAQTPGVGSGKKIVFQGRQYDVQCDFGKQMYLYGYGWLLDMTAGPEFRVTDNCSGSVVPIPGTGTITVASNPTILTISGGSVCGTGTCYDGDELVRPGDSIRLGGTAFHGTRTVYVKSFDSTGTQLRIGPPQTSDYSGTLFAGTGKVWEFDNQSASFLDYGADLFGNVEIIGARNAKVTCNGSCAPINKYAAAGPRLTGRDAPLQMIVQHASWMVQEMETTSACGPHDASWTTTGANGAGSTTSAGSFFGRANGCFDDYEGRNQALGEDPNDASDDTFGSVFRVLTPGATVDPTALVGNVSRGMVADGASLLRFNAMQVEGARQVLWVPSGGQDITVQDMSQEHWVHCGLGGQPTCEPLAARIPLFEFDQWLGPDGLPYNSIAGYSIHWTNTFFFQNPRTFVKVVSSTPVRLDLNGAVDGPSKLLDISSNAVVVTGSVSCLVQGVAGACDQPAFGSYHDFAVLGFDGSVTWTGRALNDFVGPLNLAKLEDDDANPIGTRTIVNGGSGGSPHWAALGGSSSTLCSLSDLSCSTPTTEEALEYNGSAWSNKQMAFRFDGTNIYTPPWAGNPLVLLGNPSLPGITFNGLTGATVFNETGTSSGNFRIESDNDQNNFYSNATSDCAGFGTTSCSGSKLTIVGTLKATKVDLTGAGSLGELTFQEGSPSGWTCGAGIFWIRANNSTHKLQKCDNSTISDLSGGTSTLAGDSGTATGGTVTIAGGPGITTSATSATVTVSVTSTEAGFLTDGGVTNLTCGSSNQGKMQVLDSGEAQYCDGATTSVLQKLLRASGSYAANDVLVANGTGTDVLARPVTIDSNGNLSVPGQTSIVGDTDQIQFDVQGWNDGAGHTQTNLILRARDYLGNVLFSLDGSGNLFLKGGLTNGCAGSGDCYAELAANSSDFAAPTSGWGRVGMNAGVFAARLNGESASHRILRDNDNRIRSSGAAFDAILASSEVLTANRTLSLVLGDANRTLTLGGNVTTTGGAITLTVTGTTNVTFPTTGTLATLAGSESLSNKTLVDAIASSSFQLPNGNPTVDAAGEAAVDTSGPQLLFGGTAGSVNVLPATFPFCTSIENLSASDDNYDFWAAPAAVHVTGVACQCAGTCTTPATFTLEDQAGGAMTITGTNPTCATTGSMTYAAVTAANDLASGERVRFDVTNTPTAGDRYLLCISYTWDRL